MLSDAPASPVAGDGGKKGDRVEAREGETKRVRLAHLPTPLDPLDRLSDELGGPRIWAKRDDCTGLAGGGNKARKLEFLLGDALGTGADTVLTAGAVQSNHARQTAAACARLGLGCELFLGKGAPGRGEAYGRSGNVMLDRVLGAKTHLLPRVADAGVAMEERADALRGEGRRPYLVPVGGSNVVGALGYVECARELSRQAERMDLRVDAIVHASASCGTQAGLAVGLAELGSEARLVGAGVSGVAPEARAGVGRIAHRGVDASPPPGGRPLTFRFLRPPSVHARRRAGQTPGP